MASVRSTPLADGRRYDHCHRLCARRFLRCATACSHKDSRCTRVTLAIKACIMYLREWSGRELAVDFGPLVLKAGTVLAQSSMRIETKRCGIIARICRGFDQFLTCLAVTVHTSNALAIRRELKHTNALFVCQFSFAFAPLRSHVGTLDLSDRNLPLN